METCIRYLGGEDTNQDLRWGTISPRIVRRGYTQMKNPPSNIKIFPPGFNYKRKSFNRNNTNVILLLSVGLNKKLLRNNRYNYQKPELISCRVCLAIMKVNRYKKITYAISYGDIDRNKTSHHKLS